jgi:hypothetical protein
MVSGGILLMPVKALWVRARRTMELEEKRIHSISLLVGLQLLVGTLTRTIYGSILVHKAPFVILLFQMKAQVSCMSVSFGCLLSTVVYTDMWKFSLTSKLWTWMGGIQEKNVPVTDCNHSFENASNVGSRFGGESLILSSYS